MEKKQETGKFAITVPYNHEILVAERKKSKIGSSVILFIVAAVFVMLTIMASQAKNSETWIVAIFGAVAAFTVICAIFPLLTIKPRAKNESKVFKFVFSDDVLKIYRENGVNGKVKELENCLYRKKALKQYVHKIIEYGNKIQIRIFIGGSYNGGVIYHNYSIPKSLIATDEEAAFKDFLQAKVARGYKVK